MYIKFLPLNTELGSVFNKYSSSRLFSYEPSVTLIGNELISEAMVLIAVKISAFSIALTELYSVALITSLIFPKGNTSCVTVFLRSILFLNMLNPIVHTPLSFWGIFL